MKTLELHQISEEVEINGETFVPILELLDMAIDDIFGSTEGLDQMVEVYHEEERAFGVVTHHFDDRVGFTLNLEKGWKEFQLSIEESKHMKLDQLQLFDKLREWGFKI